MASSPRVTSRRRQAVFACFGRLLPFSVFFFLATVQAVLLQGRISSALNGGSNFVSLSFLLNRLAGFAAALLVAGIYVFRQPSQGSDHRPVTSVVAFYASFLPLAISPLRMAVPGSGVIGLNPVLFLSISNVLIAAGMGLTVYSLSYLRLNFSILPEARELTSGGPYSVVRHPVYVAEILTVSGLVLQLPVYIGVPIWLSFVAGQWCRARWEEALLGRSIPAYAAYMAATPGRLLPTALLRRITPMWLQPVPEAAGPAPRPGRRLA
jgi:protein-S-isoprenylcysteine O-methyltransferase Ste14